MEDPGKTSQTPQMITESKPCRGCGQTFDICAPMNANGTYARILFRQEFCQPCIDRQLHEREETDHQVRAASLIFRRQEMLANSGIPPKFLTDSERLDGFQDTGNEKTYATILEYARAFPSMERPTGYPSLLVYGRNNGVGKTRLVCGIIRHLLESWSRDNRHQSPYLFLAMPDLRLQLQMGLRFQAERTAEMVYADCKLAWLLVLDDVGKEGLYRADDAEVYFKLINDRYNQQLPTIVTSNLAPDKPWVKGGLCLADIMGLATMSRLKEMCQSRVVEVRGEDRRG